MKKKVVKYILPFLCTGVLAACGTEETGSERGRVPEPTAVEEPAGGENGKEEPEIEVNIPENEILLINRYTNGAEGYADSGYFIDTNGDVYGFDFSQFGYSPYSRQGMELQDKLMLIRENTAPKDHIESEMVKNIYLLGEAIDPDAEFDRQSVACDMGQRTLYYYDADTGEMVKCIAHGDWEELPKDRSARELADCFENDLKLSGIEKTYLYTDGDIYMDSIHCGYQDAMEGKYYLSNAEDLRAFAARTGIAADAILDELDEYEQECFCYLVEIRNVSSTGYDLKSDMILLDDECRFLLSPDSVTPEPDAVVGMMMDGFCFVAAYPRLYDPAVLGDEWTMAEEIAYEGLSGRYSFTSSGPEIFHNYGKTVVIEDVLLTDAEGNEYGQTDLVVDYETAFSEDCETEYFGGYEDGNMPIEWIWNALDMNGDTYANQGMPLTGVFEVEVTAGHIDSFCGSYWWD